MGSFGSIEGVGYAGEGYGLGIEGRGFAIGGGSSD